MRELIGHKLKKKIAKMNAAASIAADRRNILTKKSGFYIQEAYKTLRTNVNFALNGAQGCKVVVITSAMQSEGKSLTALNLAISFAQTEAKVLIIDCDLRRPKLHRLLAAGTNIGLSNLLIEPDRLDESIFRHERLGISYLLSGDIPPNPSELLASARMRTLIENLRRKFDYIVLDSPPIDLVIDSVIMAPLSDGVLFVVKADQTERGMVMHAMEQMQYAKIKVLGFVLNGVKPEVGGYGKYRYRQYGRYGYKKYGYGYGYGYRRE